MQCSKAVIKLHCYRAALLLNTVIQADGENVLAQCTLCVNVCLRASVNDLSRKGRIQQRGVACTCLARCCKCQQAYKSTSLCNLVCGIQRILPCLRCQTPHTLPYSNCICGAGLHPVLPLWPCPLFHQRGEQSFFC